MAIKFDDNTTNLDVTSGVADLNAAYTTIFWLRMLEFTATSECLFTVNYFDGYSKSDFIVWIYNSGSPFLNFQVTASGGTVNDYPSSTISGIDTWNHVAIVRNSNTSISYYENAELISTLTSSSTTGRILDQAYIREFGATYRPKLIIDHYYHYDVALTQEEIALQMRFGYPLRTNNLKQYYPAPNTARRLTDYSGNGSNALEAGGSVIYDDGLLLARPSLLIPRRASTPPYFASPLMLMAC